MPKFKTKKKKRKISKIPEIIGLDTEANTVGALKMVCTSLGHTWHAGNWLPGMLELSKKYKHFFCYNLGYDEGHFVRWLDTEHIRELWATGQTHQNGVKIEIIPRKMLRVSDGKNGFWVWDAFQYYHCSLNQAAKKYLGEEKIEEDASDFSDEYYEKHWQSVAEYCIQDCKLTAKLTQIILKSFAELGVYSNRFYSTAYLSEQFFRQYCNIPDISFLLNKRPDSVRYALEAYRGGKFEVVEKGPDYYYEYDLNSAYPAEMAELLDVTSVATSQGKKIPRGAKMGWIRCKINIQDDLPHTVGMMHENNMIYPIGEFYATITLNEYKYLCENGAKVEIIDGYYHHIYTKKRPYRKAILKLYDLKAKYKKEKNKSMYLTTKIVLNAFYGKHIQLIELPDGRWKAGQCFNPLYASVITANTRLKVTEMQRKYNTVVAVATDSVISTQELPIECTDSMGDWGFEGEGAGVIAGCGVYKIGEKEKLRGLHTKESFSDIFNHPLKSISVENIHVTTWKEATFRNLSEEEINKFGVIKKSLSPNFDIKRVWIDDYQTWDEIFRRKVFSTPHIWKITT